MSRSLSMFRRGERERPVYTGTGDLAGTMFEPGQQDSSPAKRALDRRKVLTWFTAYRSGTADDCAEGLGMDVLAVRPRCTELVKRGWLLKTEHPRRPTKHGGTAAVLEVSLAGERELRVVQERGISTLSRSWERPRRSWISG